MSFFLSDFFNQNDFYLNDYYTYFFFMFIYAILFSMAADTVFCLALINASNTIIKIQKNGK